jgi:hypothetical protein
MICPNCKREVNEHDAFCGGCGLKLVTPGPSTPNVCAECMSELSPDQSHCQKCGSSNNMYTNDESVEISAVSSTFSKVVSIIFIVIGSAIMIFALLNFQSTGESLVTDNDPSVGLQHVLMVPLGIIGLIVVIAGLLELRKRPEES